MNKKFTLLKRTIVFSITLGSALLTCENGYSQGSWTQKANIPATGRDQAVAFTIGSKSYLGTGYNSGTYFNDFWEYDPSNNTWTQKANFMGSARYGATGIAIGAKGYVTGGYDGGPYTTGFYEYDPGSNTWTQKANFAGGARMNATGFSIGTKGYIGTGGGASYFNDLWEYDQGSDTWTAKANLPVAGRYGSAGFSIGTKGYVAVGTDGGGNFFQDLYEWDQGSNTWTQKSSMAGPGRHYQQAFVINNKAYIPTGTGSGGAYADVWEWNQSNNTWTQMANFPGGAKQGVSCFAYGGKGYVNGGFSSPALYEFDPCGGYAPIITPGGATTFCTGGSVTLSSNTANTYSWSNGPTTQNISVTTSGTYTVTATNAAGCTGTSAPVVVTVNNTPSAPPANNNGPVCSGSSLSLTAGSVAGATYSWSGPNGFSSSSQNPTIPGISPSSSGTYTVSVTVNGCTSTPATTNATVNLTPTIIVTPSSTTICSGSSANLSASGATTYNWTPSTGLSSANVQNPTAAPVTSTTYTVTGTSSAGCTNTATANITVSANPSASVSSTNVSCNGGSDGTATVTPSGGTAPYTYSWSPSGGTAVTASGLSTGTYTVTVTDNSGCTTSANATVTEPAMLAATSSSTNVSCNGGGDGSASVSPSGGTGPYTYSWSPAGGSSATATGLIAGIYTVTITDNNGCTVTANETITEPSAITTSFSITSVSCNGGVDGAATVTASGGTPVYAYSWSPGGSTAAIASGLPAGTYTLTITDANGCTSTSNATITEPSAINASATTTNVSCNGGSDGNATVTSSGGTGPYTYSWSPSGGTSATASGLSAGNYTVTVTDNNGCITTANANITESAALTVTAGADQSICDGGTATLNGSASGGSSPYVFNWSPAGDLTNPAILNPDASPLTSTTYTLSVTDNNGCIASDAITVMVNALPAANAGADQAVCEGSTINFTGTGGLTYVWSGPAGYTSSLQNPSINNALINNSGTYTLSVTDANGCDNSDAVIVTVNSMPSVTATSNSPVCENDLLNLNGSGGNVYSWTGPNGFTSTVSSPSFTASINTGGTYSLTVADVNGCSNSTSVSIVVNAIPFADAGADQGLCTSETLNLNATGGISYSWTGPNGFMSSLPNPSLNNVTVINDGLYIVSVSNAAGCSNSDSVVVGVTPNPIINGTINFLGAPVNSGSVSAYLLDGSGAFSFTGSTAVDGSGNYSFTALNVGSYFIKAELDTSLYPGAVATYASNYFAWSDADTLVALCGGNFTSDINVIQAPQLTGTGVISGQIFGGNGPMKTWQQGDPVPGVDVTLEQNPGSVMLAQTTTDNAGAYTFVNVPTGSFTIYVDVPGLDMSASYDVTISATNNTFDQASFYVDSTGTIDTVRNVISGMKQTVIKSGSINAYPNPYATYTSIEYTLIERSTVNMEVYNMLGEKITTLVNTSKDAGKYTEKFSAKAIGLGAGVYFVKTNINGKIQTIRLIEIN